MQNSLILQLEVDTFRRLLKRLHRKRSVVISEGWGEAASFAELESPYYLPRVLPKGGHEEIGRKHLHFENRQRAQTFD